MADEQRFFFLDLINPLKIKGGSTKKGHEDWLELDSWDFSMSQAAEPNAKGGRPTKTSATGRFGFTIKHNGPQLFKNAASGDFIPGPITFEAERGGIAQSSSAGQKTTFTYLRLVFNNVVISSRSLSGDDGQKTENIEFAFETVQLGYAQIVKGAPGTMLTKSYDVKSNQVN